MLFRPESVAKILADEKTMTRRAVKPDDCTPCPWKAAADDWFPLTIAWDDGEEVSAVIGDGPRLRYGVGKTYSVQPGRGKAAVARVEITEIRYCERAASISEQDAIAEGFATPEEFRDVYGRINGVGALERPAWALTFRLVEGTRQ